MPALPNADAVFHQLVDAAGAQGDQLRRQAERHYAGPCRPDLGTLTHTRRDGQHQTVRDAPSRRMVSRCLGDAIQMQSLAPDIVDSVRAPPTRFVFAEQ
jgi:hypothetical protein